MKPQKSSHLRYHGNMAMLGYASLLGLACLMGVGVAEGRLPIAQFPAASAVLGTTGDQDQELDRIIATLNEWQSSIVTLRMRYEVHPDPHSNFAKHDKLEGIDRKGIYDWAITDRGQVRSHFTMFWDGKLQHRRLLLNDGQHRYGVTYPQGESSEERPHTVTILPPTKPGVPGTVTLPLFGLRFEKKGLWLGAMLEQGAGKLDGHVTINGIACPRVRVERAPGLVMTVVLDPDHGFLPKVAEEGFRLEVEEFRKVAGKLWFPWSGRFLTFDNQGKLQDTDQWKVSEVQVNPPLPESLFRPPMPARTKVQDKISSVTYDQGATSARKKVQAELADRATSNLDHGARNAPSAVPPASPWLIWGPVVAVVVALGLFGTAFWISPRSQLLR